MNNIGIDIGSTTIKTVVLGSNRDILYTSYVRHKSAVKDCLISELNKVKKRFSTSDFYISISGSSAIGIANALSLPFVQEVYALQKAIEHYNKGVNVAIELGGEDAKILFMPPVNECRMNGSCAGGTGAFIDQMAELLGADALELDKLCDDAKGVYTIASRCGVFAKSDIQPLLNQGASRSDIAKSIFMSIVNQTVSGLAQGRRIEGKVLYIGGPLHFLANLRKAFDETLSLEGVMPENSLYYVALGSIIASGDCEVNIDDIISRLSSSDILTSSHTLEPLFDSEEEYKEFCTRHSENNKCIKRVDNPDITEGYLGIDAGSTTIKAVLIDKDKNIIDSMYSMNNSTVLDIASDYIKTLYKKYPKLRIVSSCATGYGEELVKNAFRLDYGIVETIAHFKAACEYTPNVSFIIDIGGQDIKCFKIANNALDSLFLNEACSSGCGSFLSTFAKVAGYTSQEFSALALKAKKPCDLGSRCTVFMNSSVKQAQKDGASVEDIAAGLCISVVKNALYKVIRTSVSSLGDNIVVQGGTFLSDAVLRAFEKEVGKNCIRPDIAGLMGAFGSALFALENARDGGSTISREDIENFSYKSVSTTCQGCTNNCHLSINTFQDGRRFISGNKCEKPLGVERAEYMNMYAYKRQALEKYCTDTLSSEKINIGLPLGLNMYEFLPFWNTLFTALDMNVVVSSSGNRELYLASQYSVPSDTICYPAKLMHGCIEDLSRKGVDVIFYPNMTYNIDENRADNHYNCPVVAYYPEVIEINYDFKDLGYISPFVDLSNRKKFPKSFYRALKKNGITLKYSKLKSACKSAFEALDDYKKNVLDKTREFIQKSRDANIPIILLAGRPYHIDMQINHKIDELVCSLGATVITEDYFALKEPQNTKRNVLNQWTYHSRLYSACDAMKDEKDINFVQLVSFGCGIDAITQDECRRILEGSGRIYTSLKIDEIDNQGAAKIRLRSLFAVLEEKNARAN